LYRPGGAGHQALVAAYGREILDASGGIDRKKLADIAFESTNAAQKLNQLIHPLVLQEEERIIAAESERFPDRDRIFVVEASLLLEAGGREGYDRIIVVDLDQETQLARAEARGMTRAEASRRMKYQMQREKRVAQADYVIDNSGDRRSAEVAILQIYEKLRADMQAKKSGTLPPHK
ncbi:MAG: dephospho-CoA kinase, partial [Thermoanaerobaculia bacterium]|nr:dephospho-CoA kinase [Thermoanaerobaculia bacterium]